MILKQNITFLVSEVTLIKTYLHLCLIYFIGYVVLHYLLVLIYNSVFRKWPPFTMLLEVYVFVLNM